ncbi:S-acyltransferase 10-like protein, partial [Drosera capensis]
MTMAVGFCREIRDRVCRCFPCLSDPARRSSICLKVVLVVLHLVYVGVPFLVHGGLVETAKRAPWYGTGLYIGLYLLLFVATLSQYFFTAGSSPGYVIDAMRATDEKDSQIRAATMISKQPATSKHAGLVITVDGNQLGRSLLGSNPSSWTKLVMEMYPPGSSVRWYICEEAALCLWTVILYIQYLEANISRCWWVDVIMIALLITLSISLIFLFLLLIFHSYLILTNQTTYELVRRRRIPYMRGAAAQHGSRTIKTKACRE